MRKVYATFICGPQHDQGYTVPSIQAGIDSIKDLINIQGSDGNWNYDAYMQGLYNGLVCALSCLTGENSEYKDAPDNWLSESEEASARLFKLRCLNLTGSLRSIEQSCDETPKGALAILSEAMIKDPDYAWSWHCNIAMTAVDAGARHNKANEYAATFMKNAFGVDTRSMIEDRTNIVLSAEANTALTIRQIYNIFKNLGITGFKSPKLGGGKGKQLVKICPIKDGIHTRCLLRIKSKGKDFEYQCFKPGSENYSYDKVTRVTKDLDNFLTQLLRSKLLSAFHKKIKEYLDEKNNSK